MAGNGAQVFETMLKRTEETARSLRETVELARGVEETTTRVASAGTEQAAAGEQVRGSIMLVAAKLEESTTALESISRSGGRIVEVSRDVQQALEATSAG